MNFSLNQVPTASLRFEKKCDFASALMLLLSCECWEHVAFHLSWKDAFEIYVSSVAMATFSQGKTPGQV